ncbi:shikimate 5-dehydrogenase [Gluconacetobacter diazotrophicus PA1 5]|uniref:shikimate dehydrogenase n=1 Tax=Gluconacetobacter diazotrophicus TaxID=33996 RepID=UPI000181F04E|nr:shikimate dehydrogenase [Gluconacetobacter diazotrophicus]ACI53110.1 shikimate 5-dehydrogenase [Gluconacetobacter diazotrophicus PA1 5]
MTGTAPMRRAIGGGTMLAGVIGWPVSHSRSPLLHNFWLARYGIDGAYVPLPVRPGLFDVAVRGLQAAGFRGANVTIPHKEAAFAIADHLHRSAVRSGSVNTLVFAGDGRIEAHSTDGDGFVANLEAHGVDVTRGPALVLGAGGAARAIVASLTDRGIAVSIANRTRARAEDLAHALASPETRIAVTDWDRWTDGLPDHALLVNTTSLGMHGGPDDVFAPDLARAPAGMVVADIVYVPRMTPLLRAAAARGLPVVDGTGMLLHQARLGFREWFGVDPAVDADIQALLDADLAG